MQIGHGAGLDPPSESVAHHEFVAFAQLDEKGSQIGEIVAVVGVSHNDVFAMRRLEPSHESAAVSLLIHDDDSGAGGGGNRRGTVAATVVRDDHLSGDAMFLHGRERLANARFQGLGLVQAWHDHRKLDGSRVAHDGSL